MGTFVAEDMVNNTGVQVLVEAPDPWHRYDRPPGDNHLALVKLLRGATFAPNVFFDMQRASAPLTIHDFTDFVTRTYEQYGSFEIVDRTWRPVLDEAGVFLDITVDTPEAGAVRQLMALTLLQPFSHRPVAVQVVSACLEDQLDQVYLEMEGILDSLALLRQPSSFVIEG